MHPTTSTNADIVFNQDYTINSCILWDATIVNQLASIFILHDLITIQPKKIGPSHTALYVMVSRKTVLDIGTQLLLPNYLFLQSDHYQLMILTITFLLMIISCHLQVWSEILDSIDCQPSIFPRYKHIAPKNTDVSYRMPLAMILADHHHICIRLCRERDTP